jgi:hypothetical protein
MLVERALVQSVAATRMALKKKIKEELQGQ